MSFSRRELSVGIAAALAAYPLAAGAAASRPSGRKSSLAGLGNKLRGRLVVPSDSRYETTRLGFGSTPVGDKRPSVIVLADGPEDIARALEYAQAASLDVSVRCGGHDLLGASTGDGGLMIDLPLMNRVHIDPDLRIARVQSGVRAGTLNAAAQQFRLTPVLGDSADVGVGGLTLGGGVGWISGIHGAACDNVIGATLVTADGKVVSVDAEKNPDLFWALRGGGGNFGVVTEFVYRLHPIGKVLAGHVALQTDPTKTLRFFREFLRDCPDELSASLRLWFDDLPTIMIGVCWCGDTAAGERALRPLKSFAPAVRDTIQLQEYGDFIHPSRLPNRFMLAHGGSFDGLSDGVIEEFAAAADERPPRGCAIALGHNLHGALCRSEIGSTPFIRPDGGYLWNVTALWDGSEPPKKQIEWVLNKYKHVRDRVGSKQTYINYLSDNSENFVRDAYGANYTRLQAIKRKYDPSNVFRGNRNVRI